MTKSEILTFLTKLEGPEGCDFQRDNKGEITWKCEGDNDKSFAIKLLNKMKVPIQDRSNILNMFTALGGHCDCEIVFNAQEHVETFLKTIDDNVECTIYLIEKAKEQLYEIFSDRPEKADEIIHRLGL